MLTRAEKRGFRRLRRITRRLDRAFDGLARRTDNSYARDIFLVAVRDYPEPFALDGDDAGTDALTALGKAAAAVFELVAEPREELWAQLLSATCSLDDVAHQLCDAERFGP